MCVKSLVDAVSDRCSVLPYPTLVSQIDKELEKQSIEDREKILIIPLLVADMEKMSTALDKLQEHVEDLKTWYQRDRAKGYMPITATYNGSSLDTYHDTMIP